MVNGDNLTLTNMLCQVCFDGAGLWEDLLVLVLVWWMGIWIHVWLHHHKCCPLHLGEMAKLLGHVSVE